MPPPYPFEMMLVFAFLSAMLVCGVILRARVSGLQRFLFPSGLNGGALALAVLHAGGVPIDVSSIEALAYHFFNISFISVGLTRGNDLGRTAAIYGTVTGTVSCGLLLLRICDPEFRTPAALEMALMNILVLPTIGGCMLMVNAPLWWGWSVGLTLSVFAGIFSLSLGTTFLVGYVASGGAPASETKRKAASSRTGIAPPRLGNGAEPVSPLPKRLPTLERRPRVSRSSLCRVGAMVLFLAAALPSCVRSVPEVRHVVLNARYSVLIASDASEFKDAVRGRVFDHFKTYSNVEVVNIRRLKTIRAGDFDAVLIMDTCLGWSQFNPTMKAFLDEVEDPGRIVLFLTVDDTDWTFTYQGVDAITAASRMEDEDRAAATLIREIDTVLRSRPF